ncbi:unnamed protein product [Penicillium camemberti]|uniref:Str. FM013 n=1 Tax=Penicillium camemberti (strain FM 013) TaxID=1429867 RepID=A0A0G4P051_PENC3|nr:unnamed protein product [Penicillium camemberti]
MEHDMTRWVLRFFLVFLAACAGALFTGAGDFARDHDMELTAPQRSINQLDSFESLRLS